MERTSKASKTGVTSLLFSLTVKLKDREGFFHYRLHVQGERIKVQYSYLENGRSDVICQITLI